MGLYKAGKTLERALNLVQCAAVCLTLPEIGAYFPRPDRILIRDINSLATRSALGHFDGPTAGGSRAQRMRQAEPVCCIAVYCIH